jgi:O-antigen/teichoic acid export membrane protein
MTTIRTAHSPPEAAASPSAGEEPGGEGEIRQAARGSAFNLLGAVVAAAVSFVTVGLITNHFGRAGAGLFFTATALFTLAANGARLGSESGLTFFVSRLRADDRHGEVPAVIATAVQATAAASVALAAMGFLFASELAATLADDPDNVASLTTMIRVLAFSVPAFALSQAMFGASRGFGTMRPSVLAGQIVRPLAQLALVSAVVVIGGRTEFLAAAWAGAAVITLVPIAVWLRARLARVRVTAETFRRREYWRFATPRAFTDLLSSALERLDLLLVAYFLDEAAAGVYGTSNRLIVAGQLMMFATAQSMAPHLSANFVRGRLDRAKHVLQTVSAWNVTLLWPMFIGLAFGARPVLRLFGEEFTEGVRLVQVFAISLVIIVGLGVGDTLLLMTGRSLASLVNHVAGLAVMVLVSAVLLPRIGVIGAAWGWAASRILIRALAVLQVWRHNGVHGLGLPVVVAAGIALVAYLPIGWLAHGGIDHGLGAIAVHVVVGGLIQTALCFRFRDVLELDQLLTIVRGR